MLTLDHVSKSYTGPNGRIEVLKEFTLRAAPGQLVVVHGPSGCGKSTLLFIAGAMLPPDQGSVRFGSQSLYALSRSKRNRFRASEVGFVFQRFHLIPYLSVRENLLWPLRWSRDSQHESRRMPDLVERLGLSHRLSHLPARLSAGEQQRVAVARALLGKKKLVCADEPTGNLDDENAALILQVLREEAARGAIVLLVTHDKEAVSRGDLNVQLGG